MNVGRASVLLFTLGLAGGVIGFGAWYEFRPPQTASEAQPAPRRTDQSTPHALTAAEAADTRDDYATELKLLRPLAEKGNAHAQSKLGVSYYYGHGVPKDYAEAFSWFRKAAEQGLAQAQGALGAMYASGYGVPQDYAEAAHWYRQGAEQGDATDQAALGFMYYSGQGVPQDDAEAARWLHKAAEQGFAKAQGALGIMYTNGLGVPKDDAEAARWFRKAAEQENAAAQFALGAMYFAGQGVPKDAMEAARWFRKAAEQGDARAQTILGAMYDLKGGLPKNFAEAVRWYKKAAVQGNAEAQFNLAIMYANGRGVSKDDREANRWFLKAADQGETSAQFIVGGMYLLGRGVLKDYVQAYMWLNLAAVGGDKRAAKARDGLEQFMTAAQIAEAQRRTAAWRPARSETQGPTAPPTSQEPVLQKFGTGFVIGLSDEWKARMTKAALAAGYSSKEIENGWRTIGYLLTNAHVVEGCAAVKIGSRGRGVTARVINRDTENDLALLQAPQTSRGAVLRLAVRQGELVLAYGYPLPGLLASGGNLTTGNVTAISGIGNDRRFLQISAAVQPGSSGSPLLDDRGNVIGIVEGKLNAIKVASEIGDIPQNVNFAIKASVVARFLERNHVHFATAKSDNRRSPADIADEAKQFTVPLECEPSNH